MVRSEWLPKSVLALRDYSARKFTSDLIAGITVGLVALPLAMAFAIAAGAPPEAGLYTAVVAGFAISAFGGSRCQIGGPTGAFVVIIFGILARYGMDGLMVCTLMAGVILVLLGVTGLGIAVKFIPRPVIVGFTNGIAILIASTQIKDFFGLRTPPVPGDFPGRMRVLAESASTISPESTLLALGALILIVFLILFIILVFVAEQLLCATRPAQGVKLPLKFTNYPQDFGEGGWFAKKIGPPHLLIVLPPIITMSIGRAFPSESRLSRITLARPSSVQLDAVWPRPWRR